MQARALSRSGGAERYLEVTAGFPLGRPAAPQEIADTIAFLASGRSSYTSGVAVTVDGGLCATVS